MIAPRAVPDTSSADTMRRGLLLLAGAGTIGVALELLLLRHWTEPRELIAWAAVAVLAAAVALVARQPTRRAVRIARGLAGVVLVTSVVGVLVHVWANYESAPLDARYTTTWPTTSEPARWFLAATDTVGPTPSLAPLALAFVALALVLALVGHPDLETDPPTA